MKDINKKIWLVVMIVCMIADILLAVINHSRGNYLITLLCIFAFSMCSASALINIFGD